VSQPRGERNYPAIFDNCVQGAVEILDMRHREPGQREL